MRNILFNILIFSLASFYAQKGPSYIKNSLINDGAYTLNSFEFTNQFDDQKDSNSPNSTVRGVLIKGLNYSKADNAAKETKFFGWYGVPNNLAPGEKRPAVILVHGGGGNAFTQWVDAWTDKGYIAIALGLEGYEPKKSSSSGSPVKLANFGGPNRAGFFSDTDQPLSDQWFYHAVADIIITNNVFRNPNFSTQIDTNHIGITGISWGGIITTVVTGLDDRLTFAVPVYGCGYLYESPIYSNQLGNLSAEKQQYYLDNWEPSLYIPFQTQPTLFVNGTNDQQFVMNIFTDTYNASPNEKYLRIEKDMLHGHGPGRRVEEVYDFADYITQLKPSTPKPLTYTSETISASKEINYTFEFNGTVNEAVLYYATDTLQWKRDEYTWTAKPATLNKTGSTGTITAQVPDNAQVYFVNVNNTANGKMYSSGMKYIYKDYLWYDYTSTTFNTEITNTTGGVFQENVTNPSKTGLNTSEKASKFTKQSGEISKITFDLNVPILKLSTFTQKMKAYVNVTSIANLTDPKIRVYLTNKTIGINASSVFKEISLTAGQTWLDYAFDFTNQTIPTDVATAGGINQMIVVFAPNDTSTQGTVYYFDTIRGTIDQPKPAPPIPFYDWINYGTATPVTQISYVNSAGGTYQANYLVSNDTEVAAPNSASGKAIKFIKTPGAHVFAQARFNFEDGVLTENTVTYKLKALLLPKTIREINFLRTSSTSIRFLLRNEIGDKPSGVPVQLNSDNVYFYFSQINAWQEFEITFTSTNLHLYDRLVIIVASGDNYAYDENDNALTNEEMVYYYEFVSATQQPKAVLSVDDFTTNKEEITLLTNPVSSLLQLSKLVNNGVIYTIQGQELDQFSNTNTFDVSKYKAGIYLLLVRLLNGQFKTLKFLKN